MLTAAVNVWAETAYRVADADRVGNDMKLVRALYHIEFYKVKHIEFVADKYIELP